MCQHDRPQKAMVCPPPQTSVLCEARLVSTRVILAANDAVRRNEKLMRRIRKNSEIRSRLVSLLLSSGVAWAQCPATDAKLPPVPLIYPMTSDQYQVQYQIGAGGWTNATV